MTDKPQSTSNGQQCSVCGHRNRPGVLVCENCGTQLVALTRGTGSPPNQSPAKPADSAPSSSSDPTQPSAHPASTPGAPPIPAPEKKKSGTMPAVTADTVKPGLTAEQLLANAKAELKADLDAKPASAPAADSPIADTNLLPSVSPAGKTCPNCGHFNRFGILICENCGTNLETGALAGTGTQSLEGKDANKLQSEAIQVAQNLPTEDKAKTGKLGDSASGGKLDTRQMEALRSAGSLVFEDEMVLRLEIDGAPTPILVYPKRETILGRRDPITGGAPDVDMTSYAGYRMGVSRQHAVIRLEEKRLALSDLGSSNGTFVNGVRLIPYQPHPLRDGDKIALGKMAIHIFFQSGVKRK